MKVGRTGSVPRRRILLVDEPVHVVRGPWVKRVLFLLQSCRVSEYVMTFSLFPEVVKLHELTDGPSANLGQMWNVEMTYLSCN